MLNERLFNNVMNIRFLSGTRVLKFYMIMLVTMMTNTGDDNDDDEK